MNAINSAAASALGSRYSVLYSGTSFATINNNRKAFQFSDRTRGESGTFSISALNNSSIGLAGIGLSIYGSTTSVNSQGHLELVGGPLHNDGLAQRVYLVSTDSNRPSIGGSVVATASDIDALLKVLIADASVVDGSGVARASVTLNLDGAVASDGKITLAELGEAIRNPQLLDASVVSSGSMNLFDLQGSFEAYLRAFIKIQLSLGFFNITIIDQQFELARVTLLSFSVPPRGELSNEDLATVSGNTLALNLRANQDDNFRISQDSTGGVITPNRDTAHFLGGSCNLNLDFLFYIRKPYIVSFDGVNQDEIVASGNF